MPYTYEYPRPMFTCDAVVLAVRGGRLSVLLVQRKNDPFAGRWAVPGGFVEMDEPLDQAVARELEEETGLHGIHLQQFHTFGDPDRDPRGRSISTAYVALVDASQHDPQAADDAGDVKWLPVDEAHGLAFDHDRMVEGAVRHLRILTLYAGVGAQALSGDFSLEDLLALYEAIHGAPIQPEAFAARIAGLGVVEAADGPSSRLYRFVPERVAAV